MGKTAYRWLSATLLFVASLIVGCTHNNGDIGSKFGSWKLSTLTIDGEPDPFYEGNVFWGFQNGTLTFTYIFYVDGIQVSPPNGEPQLVFTAWHEADGFIIIDTNFSDDQGTFRYTPPAVLRLPAQTGDIRLKIISETSSKMELEYVTEHGERVVYNLEKWG